MLKTHKPKFLENTTRSTVETILLKKQQRDGRQRVINGVWNMVNQQRTNKKKEAPQIIHLKKNYHTRVSSALQRTKYNFL